MKTNKYADLVKFGFTPKTLMTLSESDISKLHRNLVEGKKDVCPKCGMTNCKCKHKKTETKEQGGVTVTTLPAQQQIKMSSTVAKAQGYNAGNVDISMDNANNVVIKKPLVSGKEEEGKEDNKKPNPWAICHSQVGPKKSRKFERCVRAVKKSMQENKNPFDVILENKILSLVEKHLNPKMTKGELMNLLGKKMVNESGTKEKEAPVKDPGTKTPPKPKTKDPFKPEPHKQPKPKAQHRKHETKEAVMDAPAPVKEPKVTPGTKTPPKPKTKDPFRPEPHKQPNPKAKKRIPSWLTFNNLGIKFKK
jgi:hypothetical protein